MYCKPSPNIDEFESITSRYFTTPWGLALANPEIGGVYNTCRFSIGLC
jgi:hypothetical protein